MAKKKQPQLKITRTFSVQVEFERPSLELMVYSAFDSLRTLRSGERYLGVGTKHPLVETLKRLHNEHDVYGDDLIDELKLTNEELTTVGEMIPSTVSLDFLDSLSNWDSGDADDFPWGSFPDVETRKGVVEQFSQLFLERVREVLKRFDTARAEEAAEERRQEAERKERARNAEKARLDDAAMLLRASGYKVEPPAVKLKAPAKKKAKA